ncbi:calcium-binding protein [uncultured Sulfitobacter sp.]|uniref:calcium-binding protein n=1 Tax=uncultured Sulfitobacter sp. TaxID=191468 RepID=UPI00263248F0|nr:calcium-binding protein [uncultured Sulfitobacter sp.]
MLMLLALAVPLAVLGFAVDGGSDDDETTDQIGTEADDRFEGETGDDFIDGQAGDDIMNGRAGDDTIFGREGEDVLQGQDGDDMLCSGEGDDVVTGNTGHDLIEGQGGDDFVSGDYGFDTVRGDEGNDTVLGGRGGDVVEGNDGDDVIFGGIIEGVPLNLEELTALRDGGSLEDINGGIEMRDDSLGNTLRGGTGDDDIIIGSGDWVGGGVGDDTFHIMSEQTELREGETETRIIDYNGDDDAITVIVDDTAADADINVVIDGEDAIVQMGDTVLARVEGAGASLTAADITLVAQNTAQSLFDPNPATA